LIHFRNFIFDSYWRPKNLVEGERNRCTDEERETDRQNKDRTGIDTQTCRDNQIQAETIRHRERQAQAETGTGRNRQRQRETQAETDTHRDRHGPTDGDRQTEGDKN